MVAPVVIGPVLDTPHDPVTGEVVEAPAGDGLDIPPALDRRGPRPIQVRADDYIGFGSTFVDAIKNCKTLTEADAWVDQNEAFITEMETKAPKVYTRMMANVTKTRATLAVEA